MTLRILKEKPKIVFVCVCVYTYVDTAVYIYMAQKEWNRERSGMGEERLFKKKKHFLLYRQLQCLDFSWPCIYFPPWTQLQMFSQKKEQKKKEVKTMQMPCNSPGWARGPGVCMAHRGSIPPHPA